MESRVDGKVVTCLEEVDGFVADEVVAAESTEGGAALLMEAFISEGPLHVT